MTLCLKLHRKSWGPGLHLRGTTSLPYFSVSRSKSCGLNLNCRAGGPLTLENLGRSRAHVLHSFNTTHSVESLRQQQRLYSINNNNTSNTDKNSGPVKVRNPRPKGIVPIGEDYGGYDEDRHEEFEKAAELRHGRIRWYKKIASSLVFVSVLITVLWARRKKQRRVDEYTKNVTFLPKDFLFTGSHSSLCIVPSEGGTESTVLPASIVQDGTINFIQSMEFRTGDVVVSSFPKTGTTWLQEIVYLIQTDLDFQKASSSVLEDRFPYLEYPYPGTRSVDKMKSPRLIKTHLPFSFLPKHPEKAKILYITRNPKDTAISYYHFTRMLSFLGFIGSFNEFLEKFMNNQLPYTPFFDHIASYIQHKDDPNVMIITYEELTKDPSGAIQKIALFLEKPLTPEEVSKIAEHTSFAAMSLNSSVNYNHWVDLGIQKKGESPFLRKGKIGDWKNYFTRETDEHFEKWVKRENKFNIKFDYNP